jgi:signal transduction histidine kinase
LPTFSFLPPSLFSHYPAIFVLSQGRTHIFDRFYRVSSDRSRKKGGSGLGLAIAQAIAKAHNGDIQAKSELGQGSIFTIKIPSVVC